MRALPAIAFLALFATLAEAQDPPSPTPAEGVTEGVAEARERYEQGLRAIDEARWADALGLFRRSYELSAAAPALFNEALVLRALGRIRDARDALARLIERHPEADPAIASAARVMHAETIARIAELTLLELPVARGMRIRFDGEPVPDPGTRPITIEADPGPHALSILVPGYVLYEWRGELRDGARRRLAIELESEGLPLWPFLLAGGAALVVAAVAVIVYASQESDLTDVGLPSF